MGLSHELRAELQAEKGELVVEEYIQDETAKVVHHVFQSTKRLTEKEKICLEQVVALQTQCTKESWKNRYETTKAHFEDQASLNVMHDSETQNIIETLGNYVRINKAKLTLLNKLEPDERKTKPITDHQKTKPTTDKQKTKPSGDDRKTKLSADEMAEDSSGTSLLELLSEHINDLIGLTNDSINGKDNLIGEKNRALRVLNIHETNANTKLDMKLKDVLEKAGQELTESRLECIAKEDYAKKLEDQVDELRNEVTHEIEKKEKLIKGLKTNLKLTQDKVAEYQKKVDEQKDEIHMIQIDMQQYKERAEKLEKHRRLGYKAKNKKGMDISKESNLNTSASSTKFPSISDGHASPATSKKTKKRGSAKVH